MFIRKMSIKVADDAGDALDVGQLQCEFKVWRAQANTPANGEVKIYNLKEDTATAIKGAGKRLILEAGHEDEDNLAGIFDGEVIDTRNLRIDTKNNITQIMAIDGDLAHNFSIVNKTLAAGATFKEIAKAATDAMRSIGGIEADSLDNNEGLPRGAVMFGSAKNQLNTITSSLNKTWGIVDGRLEYFDDESFKENTAIVLNQTSGLVGMAEQTEEGMIATSILNPRLKPGRKVKINEEDINRLQFPAFGSGKPIINPVPITADGIYRILLVEHYGSTRGNEFYSKVRCLSVDSTVNV